MANWFKDLARAWFDVLTLPWRVVKRGWRWLMEMGAKRLIFFILSAIVMTVVVLGLFVEVTSQPAFCVSCHIMRPYFDNWKTSSHSDVQCVECHIPPGLSGTIESKFMAFGMLAKYATGLYKRSKPWAEIDDRSCLAAGCHDTRLLQSTEDFKGVRFDHKPHLTQTRRDRQLRCTSCHAQIVQGTHISVTEATCFLCHFKVTPEGTVTELSRCTICHDPPAGITVADTTYDHATVLARGTNCLDCHRDVTAGDGQVPRIRCNSCHAEVEHIERYDDLELVHQMHVTEHKVDCENCHLPISHGRSVRELVSSTENCAQCHGGADDAYRAVWTGRLPGIEPTPGKMATLGMTCTSCHVEPIHEAEGRRAPVCETCHEAGYDRLWSTWGDALASSLTSLEREVEAGKDPNQDDLLAALRVYRAGNPIHNPDLLPVLEERITGAEPDAGVQMCHSCHPAPLELRPDWQGLRVSHERHASEGVGCQTCHDTDGEHHGHVVLKRQDCTECHHGEFASGVRECADCHQTQYATFAGDVRGFDEDLPDLMFEAELACTDCHEREGNRVSRNVSPMCVTCHDEAYADVLIEWQTEGERLLVQCDETMRDLRPGSERYRQFRALARAIRADGSRTAHNHELFLAWMKRLESPN